MDTPPLRGLAFLLSLGGLGIACNGDDGGSATAAGTSSGESSTTQTSTGSSTTTAETTTGAATETTETTETTAGSGGVTSTSDTGTTGGTDPTSSAGFLTTAGDTEGSTTGEPLPDQPSCVAFGETFAECIPRYAQYGEYYTMICNQFFAEGAADGPSCTAALEEIFACLNNVECRSFESELEMPMMCASEFVAATSQCPSLEL